MIVETVMNALIAMIKAVFGWISLPAFPDEITTVIDELFGYLEGGMG